MKLVAHETCRVTWLFQFEAVHPIDGINDPTFLPMLVARYNFAQVPNVAVTLEEFKQKGFRFGAGHFKSDTHSGAINEFWVYTDGFVAAAQTTDIGQHFLTDLMTWLQTEWSFRELTSMRELFLSNVVVDFDRPLDRLLAAYDAISQVVSLKAGELFRTPDKMGFARLDFEFDRTSETLKLPAPRFTLERRANVPFGQERYFTSAPLSTRDHLQVLEAIEKLISSS
ncbi:hypothetical protein [Nitrobacter winogradskyi]|uniref:Uncharacterized protein n=2 Tax=Nitrobacter winogradskyi TaxID=913 RepID=A0ACC6AJX6_NITWI|nr:hypothetical protein [Nitrobacter winogradskyi]MCP1999160.1 hypothetical protein [Nitrobacter winogradskyi]GEC14647.1 hypothetical protein NWI01_05390 [Nitrobacter winogradskyi]